MKNIFLIFCLITVSEYTVGQHSCNINVTKVSGLTYRISLNSTQCNAQGVSWLINNDSGSSSGNSFSYTFTGPGDYDIYIEATSGSGDGDDGDNPLIINPTPLGATNSTPNCVCSDSKVVPISVSLPTPEVDNANILTCSPSVTLEVENPDANAVYEWRRTSDNSSVGTGASIDVTVGSGVTGYEVRATKEGFDPSGYAAVSVNYLPSHTPNPTFSINKTRYRLSNLGATIDNRINALTYYWQVNGTNQDNNQSLANIDFSSPGDIYEIQAYYSSGSCWTLKSTGRTLLITDLNTTPPVPEIDQVQKFSSVEILMTNTHLVFIQQHATYYWVSLDDLEDTSKPYLSDTEITLPGIYYLRGRDNETGNWGAYLEVNVEQAGLIGRDEFYNRIEVRTYDEYHNLVGASKTYYDDEGQILQSQTKNLTESTVLASQPIRDRFEREVINTSPAPTNDVDFRYKANFVTEANSGNQYSYLHFDTDANRNNPLPVESSIPGTLGWYYSNNNTDKDVPDSGFPYTRMEYYDDGTGDLKRSTGPGEGVTNGSGKETYTLSLGVTTELDNYVEWRNKIIPNAQSSLIGEAIQQVSSDPNGRIEISFLDKNENILMIARAGSDLTIAKQLRSFESESKYFYVLNDETSLNFNFSSCEFIGLDNIRSNETNITSGNFANIDLDRGFYVLKPKPGFGTICEPGREVEYTLKFGDIAYNFYDDAGRLIMSVAPNGVQQVLNSPNGINDFDPNDLPFATYNYYNHQGWLLSTREPDAGTTEYLYRKDGSIRFSENEQQRAKGRFSYTDYDNLGRPVESGEYTGLLLSSSELIDALENIGLNTWDDETEKNDWIRTHYDEEVNLEFDLATGLGDIYQQDFVTGTVSWTENKDIRTWYSYDEEGRVVWMAQKPVNFPLTFVVEYQYDFLGNVLQVAYHSYDGAGNPRDQFYHHYQYDADKRLSRAWTSLDGDIAAANLQAKYSYYLHGPLKRIELAGDLQGIDFKYNIQGWLKSINHPDTSEDPGNDGNGNGFKKDAFGMILNYYENNMNGLFDISALDNRPDPMDFHGLTGEGSQSIQIAAMFELFRPVTEGQQESVLKQYSAEKPLYNEQLQNLLNQRPSDQ
ncbi:MAG: hypothetical protein AAFX87_23710 [Bacteroidota bacterium]